MEYRVRLLVFYLIKWLSHNEIIINEYYIVAKISELSSKIAQIAFYLV